jgi:hypothetical protein
MHTLHQTFRSGAHRTVVYASAPVLEFRTNCAILGKFPG